jgi:hypothetical protein
MAAATKSKRTTSRSKGRASSAKKSGSSKAKRASTSKAKRAGTSKAKRAGSAARKAASDVPDPTSRGANAVAAATHAAKGTKAAGQAVGTLAARGRTALIIGGAAVAGVAGGLALSKRR